MKLFRCDRLNANLTELACKKNRIRKDDFSNGIWACRTCIGCPGLGEEIKINMEDVMAKKICTHPGCKNQLHARGYCWSHERSILGVDPATGKPIDKIGDISSNNKPLMRSTPTQGEKQAVIDKPAKAKPVTVNTSSNSGFKIHELSSADKEFVVHTTEAALHPPINTEIIHQAIHDAFIEKSRTWINDLSGLKPGAAIMRAAKIIEALEGLQI